MGGKVFRWKEKQHSQDKCTKYLGIFKKLLKEKLEKLFKITENNQILVN